MISQEWRELPEAAANSPSDFGRLIESMRLVEERVAEARPTAEVVSDAARRLESLAELLAPYAVCEEDRIAGKRWDLPGRGQTLVPPITLLHADSDRVSGTVVFNAPYLGSGGAVNGGFIPTVFNELMGKLAQTGGRPYARTAFLHVNFRAVARVDTELRLDVRFDREEGRKRFVVGTMHDGDTLVADAEALFVAAKSS